MVAYQRDTRAVRKSQTCYFLAIKKGCTVITGLAIIIFVFSSSIVLSTKNTSHSITGTININSLGDSNYSIS